MNFNEFNRKMYLGKIFHSFNNGKSRVNKKKPFLLLKFFDNDIFKNNFIQSQNIINTKLNLLQYI